MPTRRSHARLIWNASIITIALGIAGYGPVSRAIRRYKERPTPDTRWLYTVRTPAPGGGVDTTVAHGYATLQDLASARSLIGVAAYDASSPNLTIGSGASARNVTARAVSQDYFQVVGIPLLLGRGFTPSDDEVGANPVVVIGEDFWRREMDGAASAIGKTIELGSTPHTIVGVVVTRDLPEELAATDVWLPLMAYRSATQGTGLNPGQDGRWLTIVARLARDVDQATAEAELTARLHAANGQTVSLRQLKRDKPGRN